MIEQLIQRYPEAFVEEFPVPKPGIKWFYIEPDRQYIGLPSEKLPKPEMELLEALFPVLKEEQLMNLTAGSLKWHTFLTGSTSILPEKEEQVFRFIQFFIDPSKEDFDRMAWEEAVKSLFPDRITIVYFSPEAGAIIEPLKEILLSEEELLSAIQAFESDFYFRIYFFIGSFKPLKIDSLEQFRFEKNLFGFALANTSKERLFNLSNVFPLYLINSFPSDIKKNVFAPITEIFIEDPEIWRTIKKYLENHSNASLTAKQLFMHRNSLQYRIDKFIEKTGFDLKSFKDAVTVYLACLDFESQNMV